MSGVVLNRQWLAAALGSAVVGAACAGVADRPLAPESAGARGSLAVAAAAALPPVRISEIHYDNASTDVGEAVEVSFPVGTNLTGWRIVRYNGGVTPPATYGGSVAAGSSESLGALTPTTCAGGQRAVVVVRYAANGLQNGPSDGLALVDASNVVVEFLSYAGTMTVPGPATPTSPAGGMTSTDIGVTEGGTTPVGHSLQRTADGANSWTGPLANTFDACNDDGGADPAGPLETVTVSGPTTVNVGTTITLTALAEDAEGDDIVAGTIEWTATGAGTVTITPSPNGRTAEVRGDAAGEATITATLTLDGRTRADDHVVAVAQVNGPVGGSVRISEIHYDNDGTDAGEAIELEGNAGDGLTGWSLVLYTGSTGTVYNTRELTGTFAASCSGRGVLAFAYPVNGIQNGGTNASEPDGIALVNASGQVVEFISYEGVFQATAGPAAGMTSVDVGVDEDPAPAAGNSLQRAGNGTWFGPATATFGACNPATPPAPEPQTAITIAGRNRPTATQNPDPPLPVGYQDQLFATVRDENGATIPGAPVTWSVDPSTPFATVDQRGLVTGTAEGTAIIRATSGSSVGTFSLQVSVPPDGPAAYQNHLEFGQPLDGTPADDILVTWPEYVASYNPNRGQSNWVAYNLEATHRGPADRCECFTHDPSLPPSAQVLVTGDYTNSGYSRGHVVMSEDRTSGGSSTIPTQTSVDNARTFLFTNIIPQTSQNNGGPWLSLENYLGGLATSGTKEIYVYAGGAAYSGTLKDEGKIAIPTRTWKIAVIVDRNEGLASVQRLSDVEIIAVDMPNTTGPLSNDWQTYRVTVDHIEALTGYDFLSALPDRLESILESGDRAPTASFTVPAGGVEGTAVTFENTSTDPDVGGPLADVLSYLWSVDGETAGIQRNLTRTFADNGTYAVRLVVSDRFGWADTATSTVTIANVAPAVGALAGATILRGETYRATATFVDPGADQWTATVSYGDGTTVGPVPVPGTAVQLEHTYATAGTFTATLTIRDDDGGAGSTSATVTVKSAVDGVGDLAAMVAALGGAGTLAAGEVNSLQAKLDAARRQLAADRPAGVQQLEAFVNEVDALRRSGRLSAADAAALTAYAQRVIAAAGR